MSKRIVLFSLVGVVLALGALLVIFGWPGSSTPPQSAAAPPPAEVGIIVVQPAEIPFPVEYAGRVVGFRDVEVRSLVGGILLKRGFEEGTKVAQGQLLFQIDPATFQVALSRAEAQLQQGQAVLRQAEDNFARVNELFSRGVSTDKLRDDALAARDQARAGVQLAEAEIANVKLNLSHTEINAPVAGVTALQSPSIGTLIQAQQTLLTTITPQDPAYVSFSFTDEEGQAFRQLNERRAQPISEKDLIVDLQYGNGNAYAHPGKIDTAAQRVDPQTGTIQARAIFPNAEGALLPGQFVRVRVRGITLPDAIVIPKQSVSQGAQGPSVYVIGEKDTAEVRPIRFGPELAAGWVVQEGLKGGERIVVEGVIRVRPGAQVKPVASKPQGPPTTEPGAGTPSGARP